MKPEIIKLIEENPELPVVPMVDSEVVADDDGYWLGKWGRCEITEYYEGREYIHFRDDAEWDALYKSVPWIKCIAVYITA